MAQSVQQVTVTHPFERSNRSAPASWSVRGVWLSSVPCHGSDHGFESRTDRQFNNVPVAQWKERSVSTGWVGGSSPLRDAKALSSNGLRH